MSDSGQTSIIQMENVDKFFGEFQALKNINLSVKKGERIVVCGPSGSGKSTLIRCINRLEEHDNGKIVVNGHELTGDVKDIDAVRREVGMVFQSFNLFPHLTIIKNLMLAPRLVRKSAKSEAHDIAMKYLERVKIPEQADKFPSQLSGGQQQRVHTRQWQDRREWTRADRRRKRYRCRAPRSRNGVSELQSVSSPNHHQEPHAGAQVGAQVRKVRGT